MSGIELPEPYAARTIRFLELWEESGWRLKVYGITYRRGGPGSGLVRVARGLARACLPRPAAGEGRYGVGFLGVHQGRGANLVFVDWWADANELHHHVFTAPPERPLLFEDVTGSGLAACVWDLAVIGFERQAWINSVLIDPGEAGIDDYLACRFDGFV
jgi:hypothetical protein